MNAMLIYNFRSDDIPPLKKRQECLGYHAIVVVRCAVVAVDAMESHQERPGHELYFFSRYFTQISAFAC